MKERVRYHLLDSLRGITLVSMILYHGMFDLVVLYDVPVPWFFRTPGYVWQQSICWTFILLSGFCWRLGRTPWKRGLVISACGLVITFITFVFMPSERILFGILTFTGAAMLVLVPVDGFLRKVPQKAGLSVSVFLFFITRNVNSGQLGFESLVLCEVPDGFYQGLVTASLGFPGPGFFSGDYFSFVPWIFLYLCGYFLYGVFMGKENVIKVPCLRSGFLEWIGKHSLFLYMLHQPAILLVLECWNTFFR